MGYLVGAKEEVHSLLDGLILPSRLFGTTVETIVQKFREAMVKSVAFK